jgi:hypothetical protein
MRTEETEQKKSETAPASHEHPEHDKDKVTVTVDGVQKKIHRGSYVVAELKAALDVDPTRVLNEVIHGEFKPLDDTKRITIKGGEVFVSQVPQGGSS